MAPQTTVQKTEGPKMTSKIKKEKKGQSALFKKAKRDFKKKMEIYKKEAESINPVQKPNNPVQKPINPVQKPTIPVQKPINPVQKAINPFQKPSNPVQKPSNSVQKPPRPVQNQNNENELPSFLEKPSMELWKHLMQGSRFTQQLKKAKVNRKL